MQGISHIENEHPLPPGAYVFEPEKPDPTAVDRLFEELSWIADPQTLSVVWVARERHAIEHGLPFRAPQQSFISRLFKALSFEM
ncbi:MAG: hypothetical protein UW22_C0014G0004 [Candidatus Gottesmanbacteria bacterium GW2011_GWB1_44_11c]|uniref:Uncharacterized protein n=1 Tax=Candidatus Gottesmanbacteria bacterium GW2011_GWB1_44_11c TaxID=1618447 RepID=A0A0G1GTV0_9BACT|nr:MAG: hypothetical protein UW22_C0014G0004 [Candidatus Gottesmanbacteria bacterium GW2011_GWB1_44_11c]HCM81871.1 hypothetical protein [Patescibacteria group bacterium]